MIANINTNISSVNNVTLEDGYIPSTSITDSNFNARRVSSIGTNSIPISHHSNFYRNLSDFSFIYESLNEGSLTFIEMKIENKVDYMLVHMTYIDKETCEEVIRSFRCNLSTSKEHRFSNLNPNDSVIGDINLELKNISAVLETRKQL